MKGTLNDAITTKSSIIQKLMNNVHLGPSNSLLSYANFQTLGY